MELDFILRLFVAALLGAAIGVEREYRSKEAGYRTHFLVALGSALIMLVSQYGFTAFAGVRGYQLDPARVAAQVVSGIGFIGAGTIIFQRPVVRGLTTAAGIWATSGIGLAIGAGLYLVGIAATVLTLIGLEALTYLFPGLGMRSVVIEFTATRCESLQQVVMASVAQTCRVVSYEMQESVTNGQTVCHVRMVVRVHNADDERAFLSKLMDNPDFVVKRVE